MNDMATTAADGAVRALWLFNEKADKLANLSFTRKVLESDLVVRLWRDSGGGWRVERLGPDEESIDAFVLTIRFFVQDNEASSFARLAKAYEELPVNIALRDAFRRARQSLNEFLDSLSTFGGDAPSLPPGRNTLTFREIFDVFMWGGLAHANADKARRYALWSVDDGIYAFALNEFIATLRTLLGAILRVREINRAALDGLAPTG